MFPLSHEIYAVTPFRLWWAPWRWELRVIYWSHLDPKFFSDKRIATNISKAEVIGLMKLLGYPHEISN